MGGVCKSLQFLDIKKITREERHKRTGIYELNPKK